MTAAPTDLPDYMVAFLEFWRPLVTDALGHLDLDKVARELHDYRLVMDEASEVYEHIAGLTKPNTAARHIIAAYETKLAEAYDEGHADALARAEPIGGRVMADAIKVTVSDPETGEVLAEHPALLDDYVLICAGTARLTHTQASPTTGTHVLTIKGVRR